MPRKKLLSRKSRLALALAVGGTIFGAFFIGREIGRYNSPDYGRQSSSLKFLMTHMSVVSADAKDIKLAVDAGPFTYEYSLSKDSVTRNTKPAFEFADTKINKRWAIAEDKRLEELVGLTVTVPAATTALSRFEERAVRLTTVSRVALYLVGAAVLASGGIVGYYTTYDDAADYDNEAFRKLLLDPASWRSTAQLQRACSLREKAQSVRIEMPSTNPELDINDVEELTRCSKLRDWFAGHLQ